MTWIYILYMEVAPLFGLWYENVNQAKTNLLNNIFGTQQ